MKNQFSLDHKDKSNKKVCVKWIKELNDIRQITHHPEKGVLSTDQVAFVDEIEKKFKSILFRKSSHKMAINGDILESGFVAKKGSRFGPTDISYLCKIEISLDLG